MQTITSIDTSWTGKRILYKLESYDYHDIEQFCVGTALIHFTTTNSARGWITVLHDEFDTVFKSTHTALHGTCFVNVDDYIAKIKDVVIANNKAAAKSDWIEHLDIDIDELYKTAQHKFNQII